MPRKKKPSPAPTPTTPTILPPIANTVPMPAAAPAGFIRRQQDDFPIDVTRGSFPGPVAAKWSSYDGWKDTSGGGVYRPAKVISIHDSLMDIWLHTEGGEHCVAAPRLVKPLDQVSYGHMAVRFYAEAVPGYYTAWLFWPISETWPRDGEIDFPEGSLTGTIKGFMHRQGATLGSDQDSWSSGRYHQQWHTAEVFWTPAGLRFVLDGVSSPTFTTRIPNTRMRHILQTETIPGSPPTDAAQGHIWIDWYTLDEWAA